LDVNKHIKREPRASVTQMSSHVTHLRVCRSSASIDTDCSAGLLKWPKGVGQSSYGGSWEGDQVASQVLMIY